MEEKKLTDEEIVKDIQANIAYMYDNKTDEILVDKEDMRQYLNLIHRLQDEKESLKKDYIELDLECRDLRTELDNISQTLAEELAEHEEFTKKAKAEIERLTEWKDKLQDTKDELEQQLIDTGFKEYCEENKRLTDENAELQKQVDELKKENNDLLYERQTAFMAGHEQAVKDMAKEILSEIGKEPCEHAYLNWDCEWFDKVCKKYGVEVE